MKVEQLKYTQQEGWTNVKNAELPGELFNLVLVFGSASLLSTDMFEYIRKRYPLADIVLNSTAGEIIDIYVSDESISLTAIHFEKTKIQVAEIDINSVTNSYDAGYALAGEVQHENIKSVLIISDGQMVNGSDLVLGLQQGLPEGTIITGGLAGDGTKFKSTLVGLNKTPAEGKIVIVGLYGDDLVVTYGSMGGWDTFGPERLITKSEDNILYELDGKPALDIYKMYLGDYANELPGSGLLFPLSIRTVDAKHSVVRTILGIDEEKKSLTFAGNMPRGEYAQLMKANIDRLIEGASSAAINSLKDIAAKPGLAILISCVGRKLVLDQRIEEEVEVVREIYGEQTAITGFYSYGEISPSFNFMKCELHNQTMTITTFTEL